MTTKQLTLEDVFEVYADAAETIEDTKDTLEELLEEVSDMTAFLEEARDQFDQCRRLFRQLNRRMTKHQFYQDDDGPHRIPPESPQIEVTDLLPEETGCEELPFI